MKPILFNTKMVRAIQDDRKTATRRVIKWDSADIYKWACFHGKWYETYDGKNPPNSLVKQYIESKTPPYQPGDILYVRETWGWNYCHDCGMADGGLDIVDLNDGHVESNPFKCDDETAERVFFEKEKEYGCYCYKASAEEGEIPDGDGRWHPSIHMPKEAARLFLRVTDVRVERLQDTTEEQAVLEGFSAGYSTITSGPWGIEDDPNEWTAREYFSEVWDTTVPKKYLDRYGWDANPWVWVIEFEKIKSEDIHNE